MRKVVGSKHNPETRRSARTSVATAVMSKALTHARTHGAEDGGSKAAIVAQLKQQVSFPLEKCLAVGISNNSPREKSWNGQTVPALQIIAIMMDF